VITKIETGQIEVRLAGSAPNGRRRRRGRQRDNDNGNANGNPSSTGSFAWAFMFAATLAGGIVLMAVSHLMAPGWFCFGLAGITALGLLVRRS
jgi:hypothetical protein